MPDRPSKLNKPKRYRRACQLFLIDGMALAELAEEMGFDEDEVRGWFAEREFMDELQRARAQLGEEIRLRADSGVMPAVELFRATMDDANARPSEKLTAASLNINQSSFGTDAPAPDLVIIDVHGDLPAVREDVPPPPVAADDEE